MGTNQPHPCAPGKNNEHLRIEELELGTYRSVELPAPPRFTVLVRVLDNVHFATIVNFDTTFHNVK